MVMRPKDSTRVPPLVALGYGALRYPTRSESSEGPLQVRP
jgi:hypothetical protein